MLDSWATVQRKLGSSNGWERNAPDETPVLGGSTLSSPLLLENTLHYTTYRGKMQIYQLVYIDF